MSNIFIHVGPHKTGSTMLQRQIFPRFEGVRYEPEVATLFFDLVRENPLNRSALQQQLKQKLDTMRDGDEDILASAESFFGNPYGSYYNNLEYGEVLKAVAPNAKVILLVRRQVDFLESLYKQTLHEGWSVPIHKFLNMKQNSVERDVHKTVRYYPNVNLQDFNWGMYIDNYVRLFGRENVFVGVFEELIKTPQAFIDRLAAFMGTPSFDVGALPLENRGYSSLSSKIAYYVNPLVKTDKRTGGIVSEQPFYRSLQRLSAKHPRSKLIAYATERSRTMTLRNLLQNNLDRVFYRKASLFSEDQKRFIDEQFTNANRDLAERYQLPLQEYRYF